MKNNLARFDNLGKPCVKKNKTILEKTKTFPILHASIALQGGLRRTQSAKGKEKETRKKESTHGVVSLDLNLPERAGSSGGVGGHGSREESASSGPEEMR